VRPPLQAFECARFFRTPRSEVAKAPRTNAKTGTQLTDFFDIFWPDGVGVKTRANHESSSNALQVPRQSHKAFWPKTPCVEAATDSRVDTTAVPGRGTPNPGPCDEQVTPMPAARLSAQRRFADLAGFELPTSSGRRGSGDAARRLCRAATARSAASHTSSCLCRSTPRYQRRSPRQRGLPPPGAAVC